MKIAYLPKHEPAPKTQASVKKMKNKKGLGITLSVFFK